MFWDYCQTIVQSVSMIAYYGISYLYLMDYHCGMVAQTFIKKTIRANAKLQRGAGRKHNTPLSVCFSSTFSILSWFSFKLQ